MVRGAASASVRNMRARVIAPVDGGDDAYGHTRVEGEDIRYDALPVRAWVTTEKAETFGENTQGAIEVVRCIAKRDADVDVKCIIEGIVDRRGDTVFPGPLRIIGVSRKADHLVIIARAITAGRA